MQQTKGVDATGKQYDTVDAVYHSTWYSGAVQYWNEQPATVDGVLGGYEVVHAADSEKSAQMIDEASSIISGFKTAIDFGAGIGRVTQATLLPRFAFVDLVEPAEA